MTAPSIGTVTPSPDSYTEGDWLTIHRNASQVGRDHPRYAEAQAVKTEALSRLQAMHAQQNAADQAALAPNQLQTGITHFGQGASFGLLGGNSPIPFLRGTIDPDFLARGAQANPLTARLSDLGGMGATTMIGATAASPLLAGLSPGMQGALVGGASGAARGAVEYGAGNRGTGALVGGAMGAAGGYATAKIAQALAPLVKNIGSLLKGKGGGGGEAVEGDALIGNMRESVIRAQLEKQGFSPENIETAIKSAKAQAAPEPTVRTSAGGVSTELPAKRPGEVFKQTSERGFEVTGTRETPPVPTTPTITEIQDRLAGLGNGPADQVTSALRSARDQLGGLSADQRATVIGNELAKLGKGKTLPYYSRGGAAAETIIPGQQSPVPTLPMTEPKSIADFLQTQYRVAEAAGTPPSDEQLSRYLTQFLGKLDEPTKAAVHAELLARAK